MNKTANVIEGTYTQYIYDALVSVYKLQNSVSPSIMIKTCF